MLEEYASDMSLLNVLLRIIYRLCMNFFMFSMLLKPPPNTRLDYRLFQRNFYVNVNVDEEEIELGGKGKLNTYLR